MVGPSGSLVGWIPRCQAFGPLSQGHGFNSLGPLGCWLDPPLPSLWPSVTRSWVQFSGSAGVLVGSPAAKPLALCHKVMGSILWVRRGVGWIPRCQAFGPLSQGHGFNSLGPPGLGMLIASAGDLFQKKKGGGMVSSLCSQLNFPIYIFEFE
jgi:hypothetical protein